jgi:hypothetical protein
MSIVKPEDVAPSGLTQKQFDDLVEGAEQSEKAVCKFLLEQGFKAKWVEYSKKERKHNDRGDVHVYLPETGRVEVKQNHGWDYRCYDDWHTANIFIDSENHIYYKEYPLPLCAYALVNQSNTGMFWVPYWYKEYFYTTFKLNSLTKLPWWFVVMDKEHLIEPIDLYFDFIHPRKLDISLVQLQPPELRYTSIRRRDVYSERHPELDYHYK